MGGLNIGVQNAVVQNTVMPGCYCECEICKLTLAEQNTWKIDTDWFMVLHAEPWLRGELKTCSSTTERELLWK